MSHSIILCFITYPVAVKSVKTSHGRYANVTFAHCYDHNDFTAPPLHAALCEALCMQFRAFRQMFTVRTSPVQPSSFASPMDNIFRILPSSPFFWWKSSAEIDTSTYSLTTDPNNLITTNNHWSIAALGSDEQKLIDEHISVQCIHIKWENLELAMVLKNSDITCTDGFSNLLDRVSCLAFMIACVSPSVNKISHLDFWWRPSV